MTVPRPIGPPTNPLLPVEKIIRGWNGADRNMTGVPKSDNCPGRPTVDIPEPFYPSNRGRRRRRGGMGNYGTEPEKQSWMRFVHFEKCKSPD